MLATHQLKILQLGWRWDGSGTVYVTDTGNNRVLKLPAG
jgi:hypothetical protein